MMHTLLNLAVEKVFLALFLVWLIITLGFVLFYERVAHTRRPRRAELCWSDRGNIIVFFGVVFFNVIVILFYVKIRQGIDFETIN